MLEHAPFVPPVPPPPERAPGLFAFLAAVRSNATMMWPRAAYEQDAVIQRMLLRPFALLNAPDAIHHVLIGNAANYRRSPASIRILRPITGYGLLLSEGDAWRHQRRTIAPAFAPRTLPVLCRHIVAAADDVVLRFADAARTGTPVDLLSAMQSLALDIAARSMFSVDLVERGPALRATLMEYAIHHARPHLLDMLLPPSVKAPGDFGRARFRRRWMALIDEVIAARLAAPAPAADAPRDLLDMLRAARDPETGAAFDHTQLCDQAATMLVAGHETTAITLFWMLWLLASAPGEQARVADEAIQAGPTERPTDLPRARAMVDETLRLYPPAFTLVRQALAPDVAAGTPIRRGMVVMIAPWVLHRHRALWSSPDAFDPNRFAPGAPPPPRFAYMPFGAGPRVCVGAQFALAEATLVAARLLTAYRVTLAEPNQRPPVPAAIVTTQPDHAPLFRLIPRPSATTSR
jgi:cytochrome P450